MSAALTIALHCFWHFAGSCVLLSIGANMVVDIVKAVANRRSGEWARVEVVK